MARSSALVCARRDPAWGDVADAHNAVHAAIVDGAGSERIARAYDGLAAELRLFVTASGRTGRSTAWRPSTSS